jgi:hypothetical protein
MALRWSVLVRSQRSLAGAARKLRQARLRQLIIDLDNLDATIQLFVPDIDLEEI